MPIIGSISELNVSEPGVCLVSCSEARKVWKELTGVSPLAILCPSNIDNRGQELHVLMEDASGRCVVRRRFIIQLGIGEVTYTDGKPKKKFTPDSATVVISIAHNYSDADIWSFV